MSKPETAPPPLVIREELACVKIPLGRGPEEHQPEVCGGCCRSMYSARTYFSVCGEEGGCLPRIHTADGEGSWDTLGRGWGMLCSENTRFAGTMEVLKVGRGWSKGQTKIAKLRKFRTRLP